MDELLTVAEAAIILKVSIKTVRRLYQDGKLECYRLGYRTVRLSRSAVDAYMMRMKNSAPKVLSRAVKIPDRLFELPPAGVDGPLWD